MRERQEDALLVRHVLLMDDRKRFWIYSHDAEGDLIDSHGYVDTLTEAVDRAADELGTLIRDGVDLLEVTLRIVDQQQDGTTVWLAGPKPKEVPEP